MNTYFILAVAASCLVVYVSADCAASCGQGCGLASQACNLLPVNVECPSIFALCNSTCSAGCTCVTTCEAQCPAASTADPKSVIMNGACKVKCRNDCGVQLAGAAVEQQITAVKTKLAGELVKIQALLSGATATTTTTTSA